MRLFRDMMRKVYVSSSKKKSKAIRNSMGGKCHTKKLQSQCESEIQHGFKRCIKLEKKGKENPFDLHIRNILG